jgi:hypothetical protein
MITTKLVAAQPQRSFTYLLYAAILLDGYGAFTNGDPFGVVLQRNCCGTGGPAKAIRVNHDGKVGKARVAVVGVTRQTQMDRRARLCLTKR